MDEGWLAMWVAFVLSLALTVALLLDGQWGWALLLTALGLMLWRLKSRR